MLASLLLATSLVGPTPTIAAPAATIRIVRVPIVTGAPLQFVRLPWKSARFEVKRITQDNKGFLWFGASDDLRRYDGVRFIGLPRESPGRRSSGFILSESMMKDRAGMIWFGVDDFVNRFDPETGNTTQFRTSEGHACGSLGHAMHISQDHEDRMWFATDRGLRRLDPATSQVTCYRVAADDGPPDAANMLISIGEALRNAFKHASARRITVTIHYDARQFRLIVSDDGTGMNEQTLQRLQAAGHFGLAGMRERAAVVRGRLDVRSEVGAGTQIELRIPAAIAYGAAARAPWWSRLVGM